MDIQEIAKPVGQIPSGLFIVSAQDRRAEIKDGYLASWIQQISFEPLMVVLAIKPGRPAYDMIKQGMTFTINIVGENDKSYIKHFWKGYDPKDNPFDQIPTRDGEHGGLVIEGARAALECRMVESYKPGDHELVIAEIVNSYDLNPEAQPVTYTRKTGLDY